MYVSKVYIQHFERKGGGRFNEKRTILPPSLSYY